MKKKIIKIFNMICMCIIGISLLNKVYALTTHDITGRIFDTIIYSTNAGTGEYAEISTVLVIGFTIILVIYYLVLLVMYEREDEYEGVNYLTDEEIFKKYNPLMAGCIAQNRNVLSRDIIAVILNLANKGIVKLDIVNDVNSKNEYKYMLYRIRENEALMDDVEREIHSIIFEFVHNEKDGVDLVKKLRDMPKIKESYNRFARLDEIAKQELNKTGANTEGVPKPFRIYNIFLFVIAIILCIFHIKETSFNIEITVSTILVIGLVISLILISIPLLIAIGYLILKIIGYTKKGINRINESKFAGQKIVSKSVSVILSTIVLACITSLITRNIYLVLDVILIGVSYLVVKTDNLMIKNNKEFLREYASIKALAEKIENYTTLNQKNIEQIRLWKEYLTYSIAFGISTDIVNYLDGLNCEDKLIEELKDYDLLYYSCKNYLEILWGFNFNKKRKYYNFGDNKEKDNLFDDYDEIEKEMIMNNWLDGRKI